MWLLLTLPGLALLTGLAIWRKKPRWLLVPAALALLVTAGTAVFFTPPPETDLQPDYAVLLGAGLEDGQPTQELVRRMELALDWLEQTPDTVLIAAGGDPKGQGVTEASVMTRWLADHGADMTRVLAEDRSRTTRENLLYSRELAKAHGLDTENVLILTSDYHQTRAQFLARRIGQNAAGRSCTTPFRQRLTSSVRELYAFFKAVWQTR